MKRAWWCLALAGLLAVASPSGAQVINGGFETGWIDGWYVWPESLGYHAFFDVGASMLPLGNGPGDPPFWKATEGFYFARIRSGLAVNGEHLTTRLEQYKTDIMMNAGLIWSADVFFDAGDALPFNDAGRIRVYSPLHPAGEVIWSANVATVGNYGSTGWVNVQYTAPVSGTYRFIFSVNDVGSNYINYSALGVDNVRVVPEPATAGMLLIGSLLSFARRRVS